MAALVCFRSLVQRMSLAAKCSRARANMINREQRLQARGGGGVGPSALYSLSSSCEKRAVVYGEICGVSGAEEWRWGLGGGMREISLSISSHRGKAGGGGGGSGGAWYCRDHQSWRIIIAKNKKMVFSSLSNEFLWVLFLIIIFRRDGVFMKYAGFIPELYSMLIY